MTLQRVRDLGLLALGISVLSGVLSGIIGLGIPILAFLRKQLEVLIHKSMDLENNMTETRASVKELEGERNILQDDLTKALQERSQLRERLATKTDECQALSKSLEDSQEQVPSLGKRYGGQSETGQGG